MVETVQTSPREARSEWKSGWPVVAASALGYGTGGAMLMNVIGLFILPMRETLGWSTTAVTITPIVSLVWALASPLGGKLIDRIGSRTAAVTGSLALAASTALLAFVPIVPATLYAVAVVMGLCCALVAVPTYTRAVATWFRSSVGLAFGVTLSGSSVVAILALPLIGTAIEYQGWRTGFLVVAAITLCLGLPAILLGLREREGSTKATEPSDGNKTGTSVAVALRDARFWLFAFAFGLACIAVGGFVGHLQPLLATQGLSLKTAVSLGVLYSIAISIGRIVGGILLDNCPPFAIASAFLLLAAGGAIALPLVSEATMYAVPAFLVLLLGLGHGAEADFLAFFGLRTFGVEIYSAIVGIYAMVSSLAVSLGIFLFGAVFDLKGSYALACYLGASCFGGSAILLVLAGLRERLNRRLIEPVAS